jgi:hypothetical protein
MTKPVTIYGIKACDTMKKARGWLDAHKVAYEFHDYKAVGIDRPRLQGWVGATTRSFPLFRRGTEGSNPAPSTVRRAAKRKTLYGITRKLQARGARPDKDCRALHLVPPSRQLNIRNHLCAPRLGAEQHRGEDRGGGDGGADHHRYREAHVPLRREI